MDQFQRYQLCDGRPLRRMGNETFLECVARMGYGTAQPTSVNFVTVSGGMGVYTWDAPPSDIEWPDTNSEDDGPYTRYGQTVALAGSYPTYTENTYEEIQLSESEEDVTDYEVYPVERSTKRTSKARKTVSQMPSKPSGSSSKDKGKTNRQGLRTRSAGALPEDNPDRQSTPFQYRPTIPVEDISMETIPSETNIPYEDPVPFDAWKVRFNGESPKPGENLQRGKSTASNPTIADIPIQLSSPKETPGEDKGLIEKLRSGSRQSEISSQIDRKAVLQEILNAEVTLPLGKILGTSKELSASLQEVIKARNVPRPPIPGTSVFPSQKNQVKAAEVYGGMKENAPQTNQQLIRLNLTCENRPIRAVIDTGSQLNVISENLALNIIRKPIDLTQGIYMNDANGGEGYLKGLIQDVLLECGPVKTRSDLYVGEKVPFDLLLGRPWQCGNKVSIDERAKGTYLVFKDTKTLRSICEVLVDPGAITPRPSPALRRVGIVTIASPIAKITGQSTDRSQEIEEFLRSPDSSQIPRITYLTKWINDLIDPLSVLRCTDDALTLVNHLQHLELVPEAEDEALDRTRHRFRNIKVVKNRDFASLQPRNLSINLPNAEKPFSSIHMLISDMDSKENDEEELNYVDLVTRATPRHPISQFGMLANDARKECTPTEPTTNEIKTVDSVNSSLPPSELEIYSPQLMSNDSSPARSPSPGLVLTAEDTHTLSAIHFVTHHVENAHLHDEMHPSPRMSVSFTSDTAVLLGVARRASPTRPLTFMEVVGTPSRAVFRSQDQTFTVEGKLYVLFITPNDSPVPYSLIQHLEHRRATDNSEVTYTGAGTATDPIVIDIPIGDSALPPNSDNEAHATLPPVLGSFPILPSPPLYNPTLDDPPPVTLSTVALPSVDSSAVASPSSDYVTFSPPPLNPTPAAPLPANIETYESVVSLSLAAATFEDASNKAQQLQEVEIPGTNAIANPAVLTALVQSTPGIPFYEPKTAGTHDAVVRDALVQGFAQVLVEIAEQMQGMRLEDSLMMEVDLSITGIPIAEGQADSVKTASHADDDSHVMPKPIASPSAPKLIFSRPLSPSPASTPYDAVNNPSIPALIRLLPSNLVRRKYILHAVANTAEDQIHCRLDDPPIFYHDDRIGRYGISLYEEKLIDDGFVDYIQSGLEDTWLLTYGAFYASEDPNKPIPYEYVAFLIDGPNIRPDQFFVVGNNHILLARGYLLPPIPSIRTTVRLSADAIAFLDRLIAMLRREKKFPSGITIPEVLMDERLPYVVDMHGKTIFRFPKVEQLFSLAILIAKLIDLAAMELVSPTYTPRHLIKPRFDALDAVYSPISSTPPTNSSSEDGDSWDIIPDDQELEIRAISIASTPSDQHVPLSPRIQPLSADMDTTSDKISVVSCTQTEPIPCVHMNGFRSAATESTVSRHANQEDIPLEDLSILQPPTVSGSSAPLEGADDDVYDFENLARSIVDMNKLALSASTEQPSTADTEKHGDEPQTPMHAQDGKDVGGDRMDIGEGPGEEGGTTVETKEAEVVEAVEEEVDAEPEEGELRLSDAATIPLECIRIHSTGDQGREYYYVHPQQLTKADYRGIIAYRAIDGDVKNANGYIYLRNTTTFDAYDSIALVSPSAPANTLFPTVPIPHTPYERNAGKRLKRIHQSLISDFVAYLEGVPHFPIGIPIPDALMHEYVRIGCDGDGNCTNRYPAVEELIATALLFISHSRLHTSKSMKRLEGLEHVVSPSYALQCQPHTALTKLQPPRLPHYPAQFRPDEERDANDTGDFRYTGCLNRRTAFRFVRNLPKYMAMLGMATASTVELLLHHTHSHFIPPLQPDGPLDWNELCHPFRYKDIFDESPRALLERVGHGGESTNHWVPHLRYVITCRRQIHQLLELYETFFRSLRLRGLVDIFSEVSLNTFAEDHPNILTTDEAIYFTAAYDLFLREHNFHIARELLGLISLPFPHAWDLMLLQQVIVDEIAPPSHITVYDSDYEEDEDEEVDKENMV